MRQTHILFSLLALLVPLLVLGASEEAGADPEPFGRKQALWHKKTALEIEYRLVQTDPEAYYLVLDLPSGQVDLKSGARILRTCPIRSYRLAAPPHPQARLLHLVNRIDPFTPEPGNHGLRLRGRRLPLDFIGRLIEGSREASRLYYSPSLLIQPSGLPAPPNLSHLELNGDDIKALGAAFQPGDAAILIPPAESQSGSIR